MRVRFMALERGGRRPSLPQRGSAEAAGLDLAAFLDAPVTLAPGQRALSPTALVMALPEGTCGFVMARSGLALRHGVAMANGVGLVDSDYRGELCVPVINQGQEPFTVEDGMRVAQLVGMRHEIVEPVLCETLDETERGTGGFGSTGVQKL